MKMPQLVRWMLRQVAACLPEQMTVTLLADRGLCWPTIIRQCRQLKWHYLLRLQSDTRVRLDDGTEKSVGELAHRKGTRWFGGDVRVFKKAHWLKANVAAVWEPMCKEPWLLVTDLLGTYRCCRSYCKRTWCERAASRRKKPGTQLAEKPGAHARTCPTPCAADGVVHAAGDRHRRQSHQTRTSTAVVRAAAPPIDERLSTGMALSGIRRHSRATSELNRIRPFRHRNPRKKCRGVSPEYRERGQEKKPPTLGLARGTATFS